MASQQPSPEKTVGLSIGAAIRDRRRGLGLTLQGLANGSGLSVPFLSQVERNLAHPSLLSLEAIAQALDVDVDYFVGVPTPGQIVCRADEHDRIDLHSPVVYERLSGRHAERKMEALRLIVPAGLAAPTIHREGEGFWYILSGTLEMTVGRKKFVLNAGDSAHFDQRHPYSMRNTGKSDVRMIWVGTPAIFKD
ncbi:XRE family transcriptional regulator [Luteibacter rhizovicinus]|uniref:XRE family transcriptional regulator n=1 Tax=Luteibacter rhizovicinus TaxID=242606 RepID=A0A4R3YKV9_9GAMM|nr:XRE family transcriptional regulator [Luteibacter rhizovicinus]TCV93395.1 XRE family transcriptional regulator [Luteibacter rhizovicinus]